MDHKEQRVHPKNPKKNASRISLMTFWWIRNLFKTGLKRSITESDVYEPLKSHKSDKISELFSRLWAEELKKKNPSVFSLFYKSYGTGVIFVGLTFSILETLNRCVQPLFLGALLTHFASVDPDATRDMAYVYASGIVICSLIPVITFHPFMYYIMEHGMMIRVGCSRLIYDKLLRMTKSAQVDGLNGRVINLLSNDLGKFDIAICFIHDLWKGPLETILLGYLVYREIGYSGIIGIVFILGFIPIQSFIGKMSATFRNRTTKRTDIRVRLMNEIINGIQIIKFYAWEQNFAKVIEKTRKKELRAVKGSSYIMALLYSMWAVSRVSLFLTMITYVGTGQVLTARKVFIVSAYYNILNESMVHFWPLAISFCAEAYVSTKRLKEFLLIQETKPHVKKEKNGDVKHDIKNAGVNTDEFDKIVPSGRVQHVDSASKGEIVFKDVKADWVSEDGEATTGLNSFNLKIKPGQLYAIVGTVGAGKTSLLHCVLGELELDSGFLEIHGSLSYANQESFIFEGSVKSNILFTEEYEKQRYAEVVSVCGLEKDFEIFEHGDDTLVGEKGVSLSGGQKARINLARAVYKKADIYLLDDPLSAVDSHVGKNIFKECILKFLKDKTVLLVTHQIQHLNKLENILIIANGKIKAQGSYRELEKMDLPTLMPSESPQHDKHDPNETKVTIVTKAANKTVEIDSKPEEEKENQEEGTVSLDVYKKYLAAVKSSPLVIWVMFTRIICQAIASSIDYFVAQWVNWEESIVTVRQFHDDDEFEDEITFNATFNATANSINDETRQNFVHYYIIIVCVFVVVILNSEFSFFYALLRASKNLHDMMFRGLTKTYMMFFNQNPSGRILNRFSKDIGSIDSQLPQTLFECACFIFEILAVMILVSIVNIWFIIPTAVMAVVLYGFRHIYVSASRNIKRTESVLRSPIYAHTNATLQGLSTIRAFNAQDSVVKNFNSHIDINSSAWFMFLSITRCFAFWLDLMCVVYIAVITYTFVRMDSSDIPGGNVGLAITQVISLVGLTQWGIRQTSELENQMVSVERVLEYANLPSEEESGNAVKLAAPKEWPSKGIVEFKDLSLYYNDESRPAIRNLNLSIKSEEKIGIVGRTGSGKSSIIQALFRMPQIKGLITIDGVDTQSLSLQDLRKNISIIPQDPVLFSGSLRSNLDPFDENTDEAIWHVLEQVELKETVSSLAGGLNCKISDGGSNFSLGQRQLICLGRALLRKNKILVLDEATASVDYETDTLIQKTITTAFSNCTVLTIAHRLHTVINADRILVMNNGQMVEFDHPHVLLKNKNGYLTKLVNETSTLLVDLAKDSYAKIILKKD